MNIDYEFEDGSEYTYEVDHKELKRAIAKIMCKRVEEKTKGLYEETGNYQMANFVIYDLDMLDLLCEAFEDELRDKFYNKAYAEFKESLEEENDKSDWYGTINDVLGV